MSLLFRAALKMFKREELSTCPLCCEEKSASSIHEFIQCPHNSCKECLSRWIEKEEDSGKETPPGCPFCRLPVPKEEIETILGRPYRPRVANTATATAELEMDELTRQYFEEHTKPCPCCGHRIEKLAETCAMMECLCGYRFCYECGAQNAECSCTPWHHLFHDNVLRVNSRRANPPSQAVADNETGVVDLRVYMDDRKEQKRRKDLQVARANKKYQIEKELNGLDPLFMNANRLFCKDVVSHRILKQMQEQHRKQYVRQRLRVRNSREETSFSFLVQFPVMWLFHNNKTSHRMLQQQSHMEKVKFRRMAKQREQSRPDELFLGAKWLFCKNSTSYQILKQQGQAYSTLYNRKTKVGPAQTKLDLAIQSGFWLFKKNDSPEQTQRRLVGLFHHATEYERSQRALRPRAYAINRPSQRHPMYGHSSRRGYDSRREYDADKENAIAIRLLFLNDADRFIEQREIEVHGL